MPKMLFERDEEPAVVFQLLRIKSHKQDQTWKDGKTPDSAWRAVAGSSVIAVGFFSPFTVKANTPDKSESILVGRLTNTHITQGKATPTAFNH